MSTQSERPSSSSHDVERELLRRAFELTSEGRTEFEALDLEATSKVVELLEIAAKLAAEDPLAFFVGRGKSRQVRNEKPENEEDSDSTPDRPAGAQEVTATQGEQGAIDGLDGLLDFLKAQKEYWSGRDDKGQESIRKGRGH